MTQKPLKERKTVIFTWLIVITFPFLFGSMCETSLSLPLNVSLQNAFLLTFISVLAYFSFLTCLSSCPYKMMTIRYVTLR